MPIVRAVVLTLALGLTLSTVGGAAPSATPAIAPAAWGTGAETDPAQWGGCCWVYMFGQWWCIPCDTG